MKIKKDFVLRTVAGETFVVALGAASKQLRGMLRLNDTAKTIWEHLELGHERPTIVLALTERYDVEREQAEQDYDRFLDTLRRFDILE